MMNVMDSASFLSALIRSPRSVGAIAPSSDGLARRLAAVIPARRQTRVLELGAGNGCVTSAIARQAMAGSSVISIERDRELQLQAQQRVPSVKVICDDVANLKSHLGRQSRGSIDAVVCGLPWANFDQDFQNARLDDIVDVLSSDGVFTTFAYVHALALPFARRFRSSLDSRFEEVLVSSVVIRNLPPAVTYVCRRPFAPTAREVPELVAGTSVTG